MTTNSTFHMTFPCAYVHDLGRHHRPTSRGEIVEARGSTGSVDHFAYRFAGMAQGSWLPSMVPKRACFGWRMKNEE
eukprot:gene10185-biopygen110